MVRSLTINLSPGVGHLIFKQLRENLRGGLQGK